ncbi:MAG: molybdate ABC transporter substrate-binding protein [Xanthobacteraceae bacterium]
MRGNALFRPATLFCAAAMLISGAGASLGADIRVFSAGAPAEAERVIAEPFVQQSGHHVLFTVAPPGAIRAKLAAGEKPDILVLPSQGIDALDKAGALRPGSRVDLARVGIGVIVRRGAPLPDISTAQAIRTLLLDARAIAYSDPASGGQLAPALERMFKELGVEDAVKTKAILRNAIDGGADLVASGQAAVGLFNISEVATAQGVTLVGPLPPGLQSYITFTGAVHADSTSPEPAAAFLHALSDAGARKHWSDAGLEPIGGS